MSHQSQPKLELPELSAEERLHYRDRLREARYAALADAEGFGAICFALESLGLRLLGKQETLHKYKPYIANLARKSTILTELSSAYPARFKSFEALFITVHTARNDAMHSGAYARHATEAAIELCIGLEEAIMADMERIVSDVMITSPMTVQSWQPVAHARQLMLIHSFSFLPVWLEEKWCLVSELGLAKFLGVNGATKRNRLSETIKSAQANGMEVITLHNQELLQAKMPVAEILDNSKVQGAPRLWLVVEENRPEHLVGVLSPFELM